MKILSLTVHESEICAIDQCLNNMIVGGVDRIVLHVNRTGTFDVALFELLRDQLDALRGRVFVNPLSLPIATMRDSPVHSQAVHLAHLQNWFYARSLFDASWFMLDASNTLLLRRGLAASLGGALRLNFADMGAWHWRPRYERDTAIASKFRRVSAHEGACFRADVFDRLVPILMRYEALAARQGFDYIEQYPREEALFTNAALEAGVQPEGTTYIHMPWERQLNWDLATARETLVNDTLAAGKFGIKRVARDIDDPIRALVGNHFGYRQQLQDAVAALADAHAPGGATG